MKHNDRNMVLPLWPLVGCAALGLLYVPSSAQAQTQPKQFYACYVPSSGVVYRIKGPGLKDECTGKKHVEFSWAQLVADADGKVGIGTPDPTAALDVVGDIHASGILKLGNTMIFDGIANKITSGTDENVAILPGGTGKVGIGTETPGELLTVAGTIESTSGGIRFPDGTLQTTAAGGAAGDGHSLDAADGDPVDALVVDNDGNVGIGTTIPGSPLEILHTTIDHTLPHFTLNSLHPSGQETIAFEYGGVPEAKIRKAGTGDLFIGTHNFGGLKFYTFAGDELDQEGEIKMTITANGGVGIGTVSPGERLSVAGTIESTSGGVKFPDGTVQTTAAAGGVSGYEIISAEHVITAGEVRTIQAICPLGKKVLSGGWSVSGPANPAVVIRNSAPLTAEIWIATFRNDHGFGEATGKVFAICATAMF